MNVFKVEILFWGKNYFLTISNEQNECATHHLPNMFPTASSLTERPESPIKFFIYLHFDVTYILGNQLQVLINS